jgi:hypothetical protein
VRLGVARLTDSDQLVPGFSILHTALDLGGDKADAVVRDGYLAGVRHGADDDPFEAAWAVWHQYAARGIVEVFVLRVRVKQATFFS